MPRNLSFCLTKIKSPQDNHSPPFSDPPQSLFIKNFNSLYETAADHHQSASESETSTPDFATVFASQRFFCSSPGPSNSIIDSHSSSSLASTSSSTTLNQPENDAVSAGSIAVHTYSPDPFMDFRRSMQEMVEAREIRDVRENWDYLHQLLTCYLSLNPKSTHKFIVGAFADLLVSLITSPLEKGKFKVSRQYL